MARKLIMFGAGKTAELAHFYFSTQTDYEVIALTVDAEQAAGSRQQACYLHLKGCQLFLSTH
ncbi:MAG: hypothetical protein Q4B13_03870 [Lautropia sp.]|nr:hypothetical protein [Lautropia sp.]